MTAGFPLKKLLSEREYRLQYKPHMKQWSKTWRGENFPYDKKTYNKNYDTEAYKWLRKNIIDWPKRTYQHGLENYLHNPDQIKKHIIQSLFSRIRNTRYKLLKHEITKEWCWKKLNATTCCEISGMTFEYKIKSLYLPSFDRIDSKLGYTSENIQLVCSVFNFMKKDLSFDQFIYFCKKIANSN